MTFEDKVICVLIIMEARLEDMTTHMETRDQEVWEEPTIYKVALLERVMVSQEARSVEVPKP